MRYKLPYAWANKKRYWILPVSFYYNNFFKVHWSCGIILWEATSSRWPPQTKCIGSSRVTDSSTFQETKLALWLWGESDELAHLSWIVNLNFSPETVKVKSTWLGRGVPRHKCDFWVSVRCFWVTLTFELVDWVKQIVLLNVGGPHPIAWRPESKRKAELEGAPLAWLLSWDSGSFQPLDLDWNVSSSWVLSLPAFELELTPLALLVLRLYVYIHSPIGLCFSGEPH